MTTFYVIYSHSSDKFYAGSTPDFPMQLEQHRKGHFPKGFKSSASDWNGFFILENLELDVANRMVKYTKKMKTSEYFHNLKKDQPLQEKLIKDCSSHRNKDHSRF